MPNSTIKTTKQSKRLYLSEPVHIIPEENELTEIRQTPERPPLEPSLKFSANGTYTIPDEK